MCHNNSAMSCPNNSAIPSPINTDISCPNNNIAISWQEKSTIPCLKNSGIMSK